MIEIPIPLNVKLAGQMGYPASPMNPPPAEKNPMFFNYL